MKQKWWLYIDVYNHKKYTVSMIYMVKIGVWNSSRSQWTLNNPLPQTHLVREWILIALACHLQHESSAPYLHSDSSDSSTGEHHNATNTP